MKKITLAVLVTSYNQEKFIADCAFSIVNQSRKPDLIVLADDNSEDETVAKFKEIIPSAIISITKKNIGALLNTRQGLEFALECDVICFIDGDDVWSENKLERIEQEFTKDPNLLILSHMHERCDADLNVLNIYDETHRNIIKISSLPKDLQLKKFRESALMRYGFWFGSAYSIRISSEYLILFDKYINMYPSMLNAYFDLVFGPFVIALNNNMHVNYIDDVSFKYRMHSSGSGDAVNLSKQIEIFKKLKSVNVLTMKLIFAVTSDRTYLQRYELLVREYDYLINLYSYRIVAFVEFFSLIGLFIERGVFLKELLRLFAVNILGPTMVIKLKSRLK